MPRYYIDVREVEAFAEDEDGIELENIAQAQIEAAALFADITKEFGTQNPNPLGHSLSIEVRDSSGPLFEVAFRFVARH